MSWNYSSRRKKASKASRALTCVAALLGAWPAPHARAEESFTFKVKDLQVLVVPSFSASYDDNIGISENGKDDFILTPLVTARGNYPLTDRNILTFDVGVGYNQYIKNDEYSSLQITSGSGTAFDIEIGDFKINLHESISYSTDAAQQSSIAGNGRYGLINNTVGLRTTWDLGDVTSSVGYDHQNRMSPSGTFQGYQSQDSSSEQFNARTGLRLRPNLLAGIEGTASFTTYDKRVLNDNSSYSFGPYAELQIGDLSIQPRAGYSINNFDQTSAVIETGSSDSWYADLSLSYPLTEAIGTSLVVGHQTQTGIQSDLVETYYVTPGMSWAVIDGGNVNLSLSYIYGMQGVGNKSGNLTEDYTQISPSMGFSYQITKRLSASLNYRLTVRTSDRSNRDYTQNHVSLVLTYPLY